jgi:hypothetical protein
MEILGNADAAVARLIQEYATQVPALFTIKWNAFSEAMLFSNSEKVSFS